MILAGQSLPGSRLTKEGRERIGLEFLDRYPIYTDPVMAWALAGAVGEIQRQNDQNGIDPPWVEVLESAHQTFVLAFWAHPPHQMRN